MRTFSRALPTVRWSHRKRRTVLAVLITPVVVAAAVLLGGAPASAKTVAVTYGYGTANVDGLGYWGSLRDTTTPDGYCAEMQRKTSTGSWVTSGFWSGTGPDGGSEFHVVACTTTFVDWHIRNPAAVYGLRIKRYTSGPATNFCDSQEACATLP